MKRIQKVLSGSEGQVAIGFVPLGNHLDPVSLCMCVCVVGKLDCLDSYRTIMLDEATFG